VLTALAAVALLAACTSSRPSDVGAARSPSVGAGPSGSASGPSGSASGPAGVASGPAGSGEETLACEESIGTPASPEANLRVSLDAVALPVGIVLQTSASGETDPAARLFAKWGLLVRAGVVVDLVVPAGWTDRARVGWGSPGVPTTHLHVPGCAGRVMPGAWLAFAGGYWVDKPACLPLIVSSGGRQTTVHISVGVACPSPSPSR
jgi:hypothetical protein